MYKLYTANQLLPYGWMTPCRLGVLAVDYRHP